ncbi:MAG: class I SAM-dependent methyltransferase [Planctomycetes bacterium]|nr:class I SAM-dependent methyltransferase [Planctomycetota bacterium]
MSHDEIRTTFDSWAGNGRAEGMEEGHGDVVQQVIGQMGIRPGMQSLDLGCGHGWATRLLGKAAPGATAIGVDVSPAMIAKAEETHDLTSRARYVLGTFDALDFKDGRFDRVFSMEAIYYAPDLTRALAEVARVTKSGGEAHLLLDRYKESEHTEAWSSDVGLSMAWLSTAEWEEALRCAGFAEVTSARVVDSRGPRDPNDPARVALHAAGTLWLRAAKA